MEAGFLKAWGDENSGSASYTNSIDRKLHGGTPAPRGLATPQQMLAIVGCDYCRRSELNASLKIVTTIKRDHVEAR